MSENSIEFSLSNSEQRDSWLNSGHQTLDADNLCLFSPHLKHSTLLTSSYLLIILSSNPYCITLLINISNLFWGTTFPFFSPPLFLQLWARCPNPLQLLHKFPLLPSSSSLSLVRACFSLSKLLINELYFCKNMILCLCKDIELMIWSC